MGGSGQGTARCIPAAFGTSLLQPSPTASVLRAKKGLILEQSEQICPVSPAVLRMGPEELAFGSNQVTVHGAPGTIPFSYMVF